MCQVVCSICWENITKNDQLLATACGHLFHTHCIQNWMRHSETCPQCRADCCSPKQFFLTFEESESDNNWNVTGTIAGEVNQNRRESTQNIDQLHKELRAAKEARLSDAENYRETIECLEVRAADLEIQLQEATAKEKTLNEEFHYKLQDLNTEFHYKFQDLKKVKDELQENLSLARNVEDQLRNKVDDARHVEEQLRKSMREYSSKQMDLESEKAELQSKLESSEKKARWLKQTVDELQNNSSGLRFNATESKRRTELKVNTSLQKDLDEYEETKRKMEEKLRKLRKEIDEYEEKEEKLKEIKKDFKKCKDGCSLI